MDFELNKIYCGDAVEVIKTFPDAIVDTVVTSPPYFGLRDYGVDGQIGLEKSPKEYIDNLVSVFREIRRVLKDDGTLWVNLGDSYNGSGGNHKPSRKIKPKDLIGIPWMFAFAMRDDGWYLRQDIIWSKQNPLPESVTDRCTKSHEYIFLFSKSEKYYFDYEAIQEKAVGGDRPRVFGSTKQVGTLRNDINRVFTPKTKNCQYDGQTPNSMHLRREMGLKDETYMVRNKRDVWTVNVEPYKGAHFATYPQRLISPCIQAGSRAGGVVLDPFMGSGTTAVVARKFSRKYIGVELNPEYIKLAETRIADEGEGLFSDIIY